MKRSCVLPAGFAPLFLGAIFTAHASDSGVGPFVEGIGKPLPPLLAQALPDVAVSRGPELMRYGFERNAVPVDSASAEDARYRLSHRDIGQPGLKLVPATASPRAGWQWSGRVGPVRWLSPLEGDSPAALRLGGRLPGQPNMPGMGIVNVGIHYSFE